MDTFQIGLIVIYFLTFILMCFIALVVFVYLNRKLIIVRFLNKSGQWEQKKFRNLTKTFYHQGCTYDYDIVYCTRDVYNRPVASYYKGFPKQIIYDYSQSEANIKVGVVELSGTDFRQIMLTKIIKDIFSDDDLYMYLLILAGVSIVGFIIIGFMISRHNPPCSLSLSDNSTIETIKYGVREAIKGMK